MEDSREYSWAWVTADRLLSHGPCELVYAVMYPDGSNDNVVIYDGESNKGDKVADIIAALAVPCPLAPPVPVFCRRGLFVDVVAAPQGVFVMWRELGGRGKV